MRLVRVRSAALRVGVSHVKRIIAQFRSAPPVRVRAVGSQQRLLHSPPQPGQRITKKRPDSTVWDGKYRIGGADAVVVSAPFNQLAELVIALSLGYRRILGIS